MSGLPGHLMSKKGTFFPVKPRRSSRSAINCFFVLRVIKETKANSFSIIFTEIERSFLINNSFTWKSHNAFRCYRLPWLYHYCTFGTGYRSEIVNALQALRLWLVVSSFAQLKLMQNQNHGLFTLADLVGFFHVLSFGWEKSTINNDEVLIVSNHFLYIHLQTND